MSGGALSLICLPGGMKLGGYGDEVLTLDTGLGLEVESGTLGGMIELGK